MPTRIKICGLISAVNAREAAIAGADAIGLNFYPKSKRYVDVACAREVVAALPPFVTAVALFVDPEPQAVREILKEVRVSALQFHGEEDPQFCAQFGLPYLKAVRMRLGVDLLQYASRHCAAQGLLLDTYREGMAGGTGERFDWSRIPLALPLPLILSGGLNPDNVGAAIRQVRPWAVDVASGVETSPGHQDPDLMRAFVQGVRDADV